MQMVQSEKMDQEAIKNREDATVASRSLSLSLYFFLPLLLLALIANSSDKCHLLLRLKHFTLLFASVHTLFGVCLCPGCAESQWLCTHLA